MGKAVGKVDEFDLGATLDGDAARERPTCLELDLWDRARGRELLEEGEFSGPLRQLRLSADAVADFHGCAFLPEPALAENGPPVRAGFISQVFNSADFWELRESTVLDPAASELTALSLARSFRQQFPENNDGEDGQLPEPGDLRGELALMRAVRRAVAEAGEEVGAYREAAAAFGLGEGGGSRRNLETGRMAALFKRVRHNASLRRIAEMAGRLRRYARPKQRQKTRHGYDDMVGVALGDDLGAILSEELALLDSELEPDLLRRYVEAELMQYEYQGVEKKGLGPLFVVLDECLHPDTLIPLHDGRIVRIADVKVGDIALSANFSTMKVIPQRVGRVAKVRADKKMYTVVSRGGVLACTGKHKFFVMLSNGEVVEKCANELKVGDRVATTKRVPTQASSVTSREWAEGLGALTGDGGLWVTPNSKKVVLYDSHRTHLDHHKAIWERLGYSPLIRFWGGKGKLTINNAGLATLLKSPEYAPALVKQPRREVPPVVTTWDDASVAHYLRGFFDAEGCVGHHQVSLVVSSTPLLMQARLLLKRFGIPTELDYPYSEIGDKRYPRLTISGRDNLFTFSSRIGFATDYKKSNLEKVLQGGKSEGASKSKYDKLPFAKKFLQRWCQKAGLNGVHVGIGANNRSWVQKCLALVRKTIADLSLNSFLSKFINQTRAARLMGLTRRIFKRAVKCPRSLSRVKCLDRIHLVVDELRRIEKFCDIHLNSDFYWEKVTEIQVRDSDVEYVYDLTMDGEHHNYLTNDFVVHNSGSMHGSKNEAAKALALALAWVARQQNRWCCLVSFSGGRPERPLPLKPSGWDEAALADWVSSFIGGGSELDVPLRELPRWFAELQCPRGKTDLVFVTDGIVSIDQRTREDFLRFKKEWGARAISLVIQADPEPMRPVSDEVHAVRDLSLNEGAIRELMGI